MSEGINRITLLGNLGADPELRYTQAGEPVLNFRIATTESWKAADGTRKERTDWHSIVVWGKRGEALSKILHKGSPVYLEGPSRTSSYEDKEGEKRWKTEVVCQRLHLIGAKPAGQHARPHDAPSSSSSSDERSPRDAGGGGYGGSGDDDIPF